MQTSTATCSLDLQEGRKNCNKNQKAFRLYDWGRVVSKGSTHLFQAFLKPSFKLEDIDSSCCTVTALRALIQGVLLQFVA